VKSIKYLESLEQTDIIFDRFLSYVDEEVDVAAFIEPSVVHDDAKSIIVTMSEFAHGQAPTELPPDAPYTWIYDEKAVRTQGRWFSDFRKRCIEYRSQYPDDYAQFPQWDTIQLGWQTQFTPITIPITETSFGVVHGDAHTGNYMMNVLPDGYFDMTMIDLDNAQKSWFIVDPGAVIWGANFQLFLSNPVGRIPRINKMKEWFLDEYGWDTTEEELQQGC
jgi:hypothetical protein